MMIDAVQDNDLADDSAAREIFDRGHGKVVADAVYEDPARFVVCRG
jgi:hypothetical protein